MNRVDSIINKISCLRTCLQKTHIRDLREKYQHHRIVHLNNKNTSVDANTHDSNESIKYANNRIKTTKYTIINFLPKNLFEQFRRIANFYFLISAIVIIVTPDPPTTPFTSLLPLIILVLVTAVKQAYEDILRFKSDNEINNISVTVIRNGKFVKIKWKDIICGDIVEVGADGTFPCDLILLWANSEDNTCFVTTANLDGESNLKLRRVQTGIPHINDPLQLDSLRGTIICDKPNKKLYEFKGKLQMNGNEYPTTNDNILLRGSRLKIATLIYGVAIYAGKDTKMMLNTKFKSNKMSCIEKRLNRFIGAFLILLAFLTFLCFGLSYIYLNLYNTHWYLAGREPTYYYSNRNLYNFIVIVFYATLLSYLIPLSLYVTMEMQRFIGTEFLEWDLEMYDAKTDQPAKANTSDLNEDLGQIEYLFCDKTGTLTENEMIFKECSIQGVIYEEKQNQLYKIGTNQIARYDDEIIVKFFEALCLCHTVQVDKNAEEKYQASSPDEFSFLKFCQKINVIYEGEEKDSRENFPIRKINFFGENRSYQLLDLLEFDSNRKCMSIIVKCLKTNQIIVFCKGAESTIFEKSIKGNVQQCDKDITRFATFGWRTLAIAYRVITKPEYDSYSRVLLNAYNDITNREEKLVDAFKQIESNLTLIGATGVEDRLQEDCALTLEEIRKTGIKIWILTGDKRETAINISQSCKHFSNEMIKFQITDLVPTDIEKVLESINDRLSIKKDKESFALVVDGRTLNDVLTHNTQKFLDICLQCDAVLCCRMSPGQKADIVRMVKKSKDRPLVAAVGDGANDVSMIQEANVGIGIFGKEGRNAARAADFAVARFKFLRRLIILHGYLYYTRAAHLVQYFFYKNIAFITAQVYYGFFNAFSVSSLYSSTILTFYNIVFTSAPILFFGLFEQKIKANKILSKPYLYRSLRKNSILTYFEFTKWNALGLWHSLVTFFAPYFMFSSASHFSSDGTMSGNYEFGSFVITLVILIVNLKLLLEWNYLTYFAIIGYSLSILAYALFCLLLNAFVVPDALTYFTDEQNLYWSYFNILSNVSCWFCILLTIVTALLPDTILKTCDNIRERYNVNKLERRNTAATVENNNNSPSTYNVKKPTSNKISNLSFDNRNYQNDEDDDIAHINTSQTHFSTQNSPSRNTNNSHNGQSFEFNALEHDQFHPYLINRLPFRIQRYEVGLNQTKFTKNVLEIGRIKVQALNNFNQNSNYEDGNYEISNSTYQVYPSSIARQYSQDEMDYHNNPFVYRNPVMNNNGQIDGHDQIYEIPTQRSSKVPNQNSLFNTLV